MTPTDGNTKTHTSCTIPHVSLVMPKATDKYAPLCFLRASKTKQCTGIIYHYSFVIYRNYVVILTCQPLAIWLNHSELTFIYVCMYVCMYLFILLMNYLVKKKKRENPRCQQFLKWDQSMTSLRLRLGSIHIAKKILCLSKYPPLWSWSRK